MPRVTMALTALLIAAHGLASALGANVDWSQAKPVDAPDMTWLVVEQTNNGRAMFGIPDSDGALLWFDCIAKGSLELSYVDSQLEPHAKFHVHLKSGARAIEVAGKTGERLQLDDLVVLQSAAIADKRFLTNLTKGEALALMIDHDKKGRFTAFSLPAHGSTLNPFFKACGL